MSIKVALVSPKNIEICNPMINANHMVEYINNIVDSQKVSIVVFPELSLTGYTCGDLFNNELLLNEVTLALNYIVKETSKLPKNSSPLIFLGAPIVYNDKLYNCAVAIKDGKILGCIPKVYIPNYNEFYEKRWFASGKSLDINNKLKINNDIVPITPYIIFKVIDKDTLLSTDVKISTEICEDLWAPIPPSSIHCQNGANLIINLSASNEIIGKTQYREELIKIHSAKNMCSYLYTSASNDESTTDVVFSNHKIAANNGHLILSDKNHSIEIVDIYSEYCLNERIKFNTFSDMTEEYKRDYIHIDVNLYISKNIQKVSQTPFLTSNDMKERTREIIEIQSIGLAQRLKKINCKKVVIGVSGGLDSTLALIVANETFKKLGYDEKGIIGITMPCFGTSEKTFHNSIKLMESMNIDFRIIDISETVKSHLKDINHPIDKYDIAYENAQARERMQVLMDIANSENAIVIGTGDMSELAIGWCTFNGDHMSMYSLNCSIPKTCVREMVRQYSDIVENDNIQEVLKDIINTPISPELLPLNIDGSISQKTEDTVGSYIIHDFCLFYMLRYNFTPKHIYDLFCNSFDRQLTSDEKIKIINNMMTFYKRFFTQQFKRNCSPDGPKVGSVSLSPRGDWKMPSDANYELWLKELKNELKIIEN